MAQLTVSKDVPAFRQAFREKRNLLLAATDPWMFGDRGLTEEESEALRFYRQQLRDCARSDIAAPYWELPVPPLFLRNRSPFNGV